MAKLDMNELDTGNNSVASVVARIQEFDRQRKETDAQRRTLERLIVAQPTNKMFMDTPLKELVDTIKAQNEILSKQVELLKEENDLQKEQIDAVKASEEQAHKESGRARIFSWITFCITTIISIVALTVSIVGK